jgi:REP element-mobilizing transposase RayT
MVIGSHVILSAYGFWLPNDPRGSWSEFVGAWELLRFGRATKIDTRQSVAARSHDRQLRQAAKQSMKFPEVHFSGRQARAIGRGFAEFAVKSDLVVWACAILPEHTHIVVARHEYAVEQVATLLKGAATSRLTAENLHPLVNEPKRNGRPPTPWARGEWKVFLHDPKDVWRAITYVEGNPAKEGLPLQQWSFVRPFNG